MFGVVALTYGMLATFVMSSASRNRREARRNPMILNAFGWTLMAFSASVATGLIGYTGYLALTGATLQALPIA